MVTTARVGDRANDLQVEFSGEHVADVPGQRRYDIRVFDDEGGGDEAESCGVLSRTIRV